MFAPPPHPHPNGGGHGGHGEYGSRAFIFPTTNIELKQKRFWCENIIRGGESLKSIKSPNLSSAIAVENCGRLKQSADDTSCRL
jgi:hypothetical protein